MHEESNICKFGKGCERLLCMYKHEFDKNEEDDDSESDDSSDDSDDDGSEEIDVEELKPVLGKLEEAFEKLSISLKKTFWTCKV